MTEATISHFPALGLSFSTEDAHGGDVDPSLLTSWNALVAHSQGPEAVFQTPAYFAFISDLPNKHNTQKLVVVRDIESRVVVGVLPLRAGRRTLPLALGSRAVLRLRMQTIALLGSVPLAPHDAAVLEQLFDYIFAAFPHTGSITMQAVPADSPFFHALTGSAICAHATASTSRTAGATARRRPCRPASPLTSPSSRPSGATTCSAS